MIVCMALVQDPGNALARLDTVQTTPLGPSAPTARRASSQMLQATVQVSKSSRVSLLS